MLYPKDIALIKEQMNRTDRNEPGDVWSIVEDRVKNPLAVIQYTAEDMANKKQGKLILEQVQRINDFLDEFGREFRDEEMVS